MTTITYDDFVSAITDEVLAALKLRFATDDLSFDIVNCFEFPEDASADIPDDLDFQDEIEDEDVDASTD